MPSRPVRGALLALLLLALPAAALAAPAAASASASASASAAAPAPASAAAAASAPAPASASAPAPAPRAADGVPVRLRDTLLFVLRVPHAGVSPEERARAASSAIRAAAESGTSVPVRIENRGEARAIFAGDRLVVELGPDDAAAENAPSLDAHAGTIAGRLREHLQREQTRSAALLTLLSIALVALSGVVALFFARKIGQLADRARAFLVANPERVPAIRLQSIEVIRPESLRAALLIAVAAGRVLLRLGIFYGFLLITLSLFEPTRGYAERLSGFVFGPLYALLARLIGSLPLLVVAAIATIALVVLVRFIGLFFEGVARGQTTLDWLPADLAAPTSLLVRAAVILGFLLIAAPLVTGDDDGALVRAGTVVMAALGLSTTPLLACGAVGISVVYGRRLSVGDFVEIGGRGGRVRAVSLLEVEMECEDGTLRVPHLYSLLRPTRILGPEPPVAVELSLPPAAAMQDDVRELLLEAARAIGKQPRVELLQVDAEGAWFRVTVRAASAGARGELLSLLTQALLAAEIPLGRARVKEAARLAAGDGSRQ